MLCYFQMRNKETLIYTYGLPRWFSSREPPAKQKIWV